MVREAIDAEPYRIGPRIKKLRGSLAKLDSASTERAVAPYPPPRPSGESSLIYRKLRGGGRRLTGLEGKPPRDWPSPEIR
jgi:hypothetical protein